MKRNWKEEYLEKLVDDLSDHVDKLEKENESLKKEVNNLKNENKKLKIINIQSGWPNYLIKFIEHF